MASGTLGQSSLLEKANTEVYSVPSNKTAVFNINCLNANNSITSIRIAIANNTTPNLSEYIEYNTQIQPFTILERTGIVASANKKVIVYSTVGDVSVNIYGFEE